MPAADRAATVSDGAATPAADAEDRARAEIVVPLHADLLFAYVSDVERLFRLNPHLEIQTWQGTPAGFRLCALNEINERSIETDALTEYLPDARGIVIRYTTGLKRATTITVEADTDSGHSRLVVTDYYPVIEDMADPRLVDVDRSLGPWVTAIHRHLVHRARWGKLPGWRWWNERFMPGLPPRQRRIVRLIFWVSVLEFVVFLALVSVLVVSL